MPSDVVRNSQTYQHGKKPTVYLDTEFNLDGEGFRLLQLQKARAFGPLGEIN
jgi:hypothetical protein